MEVGLIADTIFGNKLYQIRARRALPILIQQAWQKTPITYSELAVKLEIPNPPKRAAEYQSGGKYFTNLNLDAQYFQTTLF